MLWELGKQEKQPYKEEVDCWVHKVSMLSDGHN
jgi:hypothetical protein